MLVSLFLDDFLNINSQICRILRPVGRCVDGCKPRPCLAWSWPGGDLLSISLVEITDFVTGSEEEVGGSFPPWLLPLHSSYTSLRRVQADKGGKDPKDENIQKLYQYEVLQRSATNTYGNNSFPGFARTLFVKFVIVITTTELQFPSECFHALSFFKGYIDNQVLHLLVKWCDFGQGNETSN